MVQKIFCQINSNIYLLYFTFCEDEDCCLKNRKKYNFLTEEEEMDAKQETNKCQSILNQIEKH